jgi:hypothetical protein
MRAASQALLSAVVLVAAVVDQEPAASHAVDSGHARQQLPDGPGKELLPRLCGGCHDLTFRVSTRETEEGWTRIVNDMRSKGADGTEEEFAKVIAYLTANMGKAGMHAGHASLGTRGEPHEELTMTVFPARRTMGDKQSAS